MPRGAETDEATPMPIWSFSRRHEYPERDEQYRQRHPILEIET
jgi:hypothetical protein